MVVDLRPGGDEGRTALETVAEMTNRQRIGVRLVIVHDCHEIAGHQKLRAVEALRDHHKGVGSGRTEAIAASRLYAKLHPLRDGPPFPPTDKPLVEAVREFHFPAP